MSAPAVVSFLGVPGWGALHLQLPAGTDPAAMAQRLRRAQGAAGRSCPPAFLLAAFVRQQRDAQPLPRPWGALPAGGLRLSHRYRIVCRGPGPRLEVSAWCWLGPARGWSPCGHSLPLALFLEVFDPPPVGTAMPGPTDRAQS